MHIGELTERMAGADRLLVVGADRKVLYRGYVGNFGHAGIDPARGVARIEMGMETYRKEDVLWDWARMEKMQQAEQKDREMGWTDGQLEHFAFMRVTLTNPYACGVSDSDTLRGATV